MFSQRNKAIIMRSRPMKVVVILITSWSFLFNTVSYDLSYAAVSIMPTHAGINRSDNFGLAPTAFDINNASVPFRFGEIKDAFKGSNGKTIIHIQDAHCNYSAQHSTEAIIKHLVDTYNNVGLVSLEGGKGNYDLSAFTSIKDPEVRKRVSDYFVKEGRISGAEFFAINNPGKVKLFGAEDGLLYMENLNAYRASLIYKEEADRYLNSLSLAITNLKLKIYSPELKDADDKIRSYKENRIDFEAYTAFLKNKAQANKIDIKKHVNLSALLDILKDEKSINFKDANRERNILIDRLSQKLSTKDLEELTVKTVQFKQGDLANENFYGYLFKKARFTGVDFSKLPNLVKYSGYVNRYESSDKVSLYKEMAALEASVIENLTITDDQKILHSLDRDLAIMKGMFSIALTKEDFDYYIANKYGFNAKRFMDFINKKAPLYGFNFKISEGVMKLDSYRDSMEKFYVFSMKRDEAFIKNIENKLKAEKKNVTILVTGGFHTGNLLKLLKEKGYSYVSVMPKFEKTDIENPYFKILSGGKSGIETIIESCISNIAVPAMNSEMSEILSKLGIEGTKDRDNNLVRDLYMLSIDVMRALTADPKEGIVLTVPGGHLRLTYEEPSAGSFSENMGVVNGRALYAIRLPNEKYDPNSENNVMFNRDKMPLERTRPAHEVVWDLLLKMAHDQGYKGLEAYSLSDILKPGTELYRAMEARMGKDNIKTLLRICDEPYGNKESERLIHVVTGKNNSVVPWNVASYSSGYGVNITYIDNTKEFIDNLLHELNSAAYHLSSADGKEITHEENAPDKVDSQEKIAGILNVIENGLRTASPTLSTPRSGDPATGGMPVAVSNKENVPDDFAIAIASCVLSGNGSSEFNGLMDKDVLNDIVLTSKDDAARAMAYSRLAYHPLSEHVWQGGKAAIAALENIAEISGSDLAKAIANKRLVTFYSSKKNPSEYWRAYDRLEDIANSSEVDDAARAVARGWFLEFYKSFNTDNDAIKKYQDVLSDIFSQSKDDVAKVIAAISLGGTASARTKYIHEIASGVLPGSIRARAIALDHLVAHDYLERVYLKGVYGHWLEDIVRKKVKDLGDKKIAEKKSPRGDLALTMPTGASQVSPQTQSDNRGDPATGAMPGAVEGVQGIIDGANVTDEVAIATACDALLQSLGYDRSMEVRQFEAMDASFDRAVKVLGWVTRTSADPVAKAMAYNALASVTQSGYGPDVSSGAIEELIAITNSASVNDLAKAVANQKLVRRYSRLQEYDNREVAINKLKTIVEKSTDDAAKALAIGELQKAYLEISLHNDKVRDIFLHSEDEVARVIAGTVLKEDGFLRGIISGSTPASVRARTIAFAYFGSPFSGSEYSKGKNNHSKYYRDRSNSISYLNSIVVAKAQEVPNRGDAANRNAITLPDYESIRPAAPPSESRGDFAAAEMLLSASLGAFEQDLTTSITALTETTIKGYAPTLELNKPGAIVMLIPSKQWGEAKKVISGTRAAIDELITKRLPGQNIKVFIKEDTEENRIAAAGELSDVPLDRRIVFATTGEDGINQEYEDLKGWGSPIMLTGKSDNSESLFVSIPKCLRVGLEGLNIQEVMNRDGITIDDKQSAIDRFMSAITAMGDLDQAKIESMVKSIMENNGIHNVLLAVNIHPANINDIPAMEERTKEVMRSL